MSAPAPTLPPILDADQLARLEKLALFYGSDVKALIHEALAQYLEHQERYAEAVHEGLAAAEAGDLLDHAAVMDELRRRFGPA